MHLSLRNGPLRRRLTGVWLFAVLVLGGSVLGGEPGESPQRVVDQMARRRALRQGLEYLAAKQRADGSWQTETSGGGAACLGIMGLAVTAFMADGNVPDEGRYADHVRRGLDFVVKGRQHDGLLVLRRHGAEMYEHGLALLALAEAYGMTHDQSLRKPLDDAVKLSLACQGPRGGWGYTATPATVDLSLAVMQLMGLRAARNAGMHVPEETIERALKYIASCYSPQAGAFGYGGPGASFTMTASGVTSLQACGKMTVTDEKVRRGLEFLVEGSEQFSPSNSGWYYYGLYYLSQAAFQAGGDYWRAIYPKVVDDLVAAQAPDGSWSGSGSGRVMATSIAVIVLSIPNRYLPIFIQEHGSTP